MKKTYESTEIIITLFKHKEVITASSEEVFTPSYEKGNDDTEIL